MNPIPLSRRLAAEFIGTVLIVSVFVGSGVMAAKLAGEHYAAALLGNSIATGAAVYAILSAFAPVSAMFNPAMTLVARLAGWISTSDAIAYLIAQVAGAIAGVSLVHLMYGMPIVQSSAAVPLIPNLWLAEGLATFTLFFTILSLLRSAPDRVAGAVSLYVIAAFWFTASLNPAVVIGRMLTATFDGIARADVPALIVAEFAGALLAAGAVRWLYEQPAAAVVSGEPAKA
jgi:glycerol uptake facilitator-like aquaporin